MQKDSLRAIKASLEQNAMVVESVAYPAQLIEKMGPTMQYILLGLVILAGIFSILSIVLIDNTIRLAMYSNRFLIKTMQMVGATRSFISRPMNIRAIINGSFAALISIALIYGLILAFENFLPYLKDRPLSLKRNPNGINDKGFYHKDAGENVPSFVDVFKIKVESNNKIIDYIVCNNKATLLYVVNLGCIEINPWNSTTKKPGHPTWMVIDIDPSDENTFTEVVDTALDTKMILDKAGVKCYCKTSGASGLHVYIPFKNKYDYETVKDFAHIIATLVQEQLPQTTTLERSLSKRGPRIYIDWLLNRTGQTLASVYSLRPVPGATVSAPLDW